MAALSDSAGLEHHEVATKLSLSLLWLWASHVAGPTERKINSCICLNSGSECELKWLQSGMMGNKKFSGTWMRCLNWPHCLPWSWVMELSEPFKSQERLLLLHPSWLLCLERGGEQSGIEGPDKSQGGVHNDGSDLQAQLCLYCLLRAEMWSSSAEEPWYGWVIISEFILIILLILQFISLIFFQKF